MMKTTPDPCAAPDGDDDRAAAIRMVEGEFMFMAGKFRRLIASRAERLSPGLLPGGFKVFTTIALEGPVTATAVAEQLLVDKSQLSRMVADLESRGLIVRSPDPADRRAQLLEATEQARADLDALRGDPSEVSMRSKLEAWELADIERLGDLLHALNQEQDLRAAS